MDEPLSNLDAKLRVQMRTEVSRLQKRLGTTTVYVTHDQIEAMTLGDRVAVMRGGVIQQVGPPEELYNRPANLFVAGFIGSPAMNFMPATVEGDMLRSPLGDMRLPDERRRRLAVRRRPRARRSSSASVRSTSRTPPSSATSVTRAPSSSANVDVLESMGSDKFAYFTVKSERAHRASTRGAGRGRRRRRDGAEDGVQMTARLDAASDAKEDEELELWLDLRRVHVFDPETGENLTVDTVEGGDEADRQAEAPPKLREAEPQGASARPARERPRARPRRCHRRGACGGRLTAQARDDLVAPLVRADEPVALAGDAQVGLGLGAAADQVGLVQHRDDRLVLLLVPAPGGLGPAQVLALVLHEPEPPRLDVLAELGVVPRVAADDRAAAMSSGSGTRWRKSRS